MRFARFFVSIMILLIASIAMPSVARAESTWTGTQVITTTAGEFAFGDEIGVRVHLARFWVPKTSFAGGFVYAGPTITREIGNGMTLWVSPQATAWLNWFEGMDAFGGSVWANVSRGAWGLFLEGDYVLSEDGTSHVYYGYYAYDRASNRRVLNYGVQVEQTDSDVDYGPHMGLSTGAFHTEVQYYMDFEDGDIYHAVRLVVAVNFFGEAPDKASAK